LGLQVGHSVGQVLQELHLILEKLLHGWIHWCWLWCTARAAASTLACHWRLINSWSGPGVNHLSIRNIDLDYDSDGKAKMINNADFLIKTDSDSCKETEISRCTGNQKSRIFLEIWCIKLMN
jgi:hypothetical protein